MDQSPAGQRTDTDLALGQALEELLGAESSEAPHRARVRRFERGDATVLDLRDGSTPRPARSPAADPDAVTRGELTEIADRLEQSLADGDAALAARVDELAASLNLFAHEGIVARGALDVLTTSVEHHLSRLSQTRASLDGLAGVVERQRSEGQATGARLDAVEAAQRTARDTTAAALDRLTEAVVASRARLTTVEQAVSRLQAWARDAQADGEPLDRRLAALDARVAELQADDRLAALNAKVAELHADDRFSMLDAKIAELQADDRLATVQSKLTELQADHQDVVATLRAELDAATARAEDLAALVQRQAGQLTRLRAQVKALTPAAPTATPAATRPSAKRAGGSPAPAKKAVKAVKAVKPPAAPKRRAR